MYGNNKELLERFNFNYFKNINNDELNNILELD